MRVTEEMTTEAGGPLYKLADFIDTEDSGIKIDRMGDVCQIIVDSCAYPNKSVRVDLADLRGIIVMLRVIADEIEELYGS